MNGLAPGLVIVVVIAIVAAFGPRRLMGRDGGVLKTSLLAIGAAAIGAAVLGLTRTYLSLEAAVALGALAAILAAMAVIDVRRLLVPDLHVVLIAVIGLSGVLGRGWLEALLGAAVGGGLLWSVRFFYRRTRGQEGLGLGDVKLALALGAVLGPQPVLWVVLGGAMLGLLLGATCGGGRSTAVPFGAAMALPALGVAVWGQVA